MNITMFSVVSVFCLLSGSALGASKAFVGAYEISDPGVQFVQPPASFGSLNPTTGKRGAFHQVPAIPDTAAATPDGSEIWTLVQASVGESAGSVVILNPVSGTVLGTIPLPASPSCLAGILGGYSCGAIAFLHDGSIAYVEVVGSSGMPQIFAISTVTHAIGPTFSVLNSGTSSLAVSPDDSELFVSGSLLSVIDTATLTLIATIAVSADALQFAGSTLLAADYGGSSIDFIDPQTLVITGSVLTSGTPESIGTSPDGSLAYVYVEAGILPYLTPQIDVVTVASATLAGTYTLSFFPGGLLVSPSGYQIITTNGNQVVALDPTTLTVIHQTAIVSPALLVFAKETLYLYYASGLVSVVDPVSETVTAQIPVGSGQLEFTTDSREDKVYVMSEGSTTVIDAKLNAVEAVLPIGADTDFGPSVAVAGDQVYALGNELTSYNMRTGVTTNVPLPDAVALSKQRSIGDTCYLAYGPMAASPDRKYLYVLDYDYICTVSPATSAPGLAIYETASNTLIAQLSTTGFSIAFSPLGEKAYIVSGTTITVISTVTQKVIGTLSFTGVGGLSNLCVSPDGKTFYALTGSAVAVLDPATQTVLNQFPVPSAPSGLAISRDGTTLFMGLSAPDMTSLGLMNAHSGALTFVNTNYNTSGVVSGS